MRRSDEPRPIGPDGHEVSDEAAAHAKLAERLVERPASELARSTRLRGRLARLLQPGPLYMRRSEPAWIMQFKIDMQRIGAPWKLAAALIGGSVVIIVAAFVVTMFDL